MPQTIIVKNSNVSSKAPLSSDLELGELAINTWDGKLFLKQNDGSERIVTLGEGQAPAQHTHLAVDITDETWVDAAELATALADKADILTELTSSDVSLINITNPTFANDITLDFPYINQANGMVKIGLDGLIPGSLLPTVQKTLIGAWDASSNTLPPDGSDIGDYYVISVAGTIQLIHGQGGPFISTPVKPGDQIVYTGISGRWYFVIGVAVTIASAVGYDPTGLNIILTTNVQDAVAELDTEIQRHNDDTANPHSVTASQVGALEAGDNISLLTNDANYLSDTDDIDGGSY